MSRPTKTLMEKFEDLIYQATSDELQQMQSTLNIAVRLTAVLRVNDNPAPAEKGAAARKSRGKGTTGTAPLGETGTAGGK